MVLQEAAVTGADTGVGTDRGAAGCAVGPGAGAEEAAAACRTGTPGAAAALTARTPPAAAGAVVTTVVDAAAAEVSAGESAPGKLRPKWSKHIKPVLGAIGSFELWRLESRDRPRKLP